jgi:hypothetical protein
MIFFTSLVYLFSKEKDNVENQILFCFFFADVCMCFDDELVLSSYSAEQEYDNNIDD